MAYVAIFKASLVALAASRYSSSVILPVASEQIFLLPVLFLELLVAESTSHAKLNKRLQAWSDEDIAKVIVFVDMIEK